MRLYSKSRFHAFAGNSKVLAVFLSVAFLVATYSICGLIWEYTLNSWLEYLDKPTRVEWYFAGLLGIIPIVGYLTIPAALVTWFALTFFLV